VGPNGLFLSPRSRTDNGCLTLFAW
jgi:hypothetical protein